MRPSLFIVALMVVGFFALSDFSTNARTYKELAAHGRLQNGEVIGADEVQAIRSAPDLADWWRDMKEVNALFNLTDLNNERIVRVSIEKPFAALMMPDEPLPDKAFREVYVAARTAAQMTALCTELLGTIADQCVVKRPRGKLTDKGRAAMSARLQFIPKAHPGLRGASPAARVTVLPLGFSRGAKALNTPDGRVQMLTGIAKACAAVRRVVGNCVIHDVRFVNDPRSTAKGQPLMNVSVKLAYFADPEAVNPAEIDAALRGLGREMDLFKRNKG